MGWLGYLLGLDDATGPFYLFWSGVGANLSVLGAVWVLLRKHQCHVHRCWRIARVPAGSYLVCHRHHPGLVDSAPTTDELIQHVEEVNDAGRGP